jgi:hypothetical protein
MPFLHFYNSMHLKWKYLKLKLLYAIDMEVMHIDNNCTEILP